MEGQKVVASQTDNNQSEPQGVALEERINGIAEQAEEKEEMKKGEDIVEHSRSTGVLCCRFILKRTFFTRLRL